MSSSVSHQVEHPRHPTTLSKLDLGCSSQYWFDGWANPRLPFSLFDTSRKGYGHSFATLCRAALSAIAVAGSCVVATAAAWAGDPVAHDIAAEIGLNFHGQQLAATQGESAVFDYDGDGLRDILLSTHGGSPWPSCRLRPTGPSGRSSPGPSSKRIGMAVSPPTSAASMARACRTGCPTSTASPAPARAPAPRNIRTRCSSSAQTTPSRTSPGAGCRRRPWPRPRAGGHRL